MFRILGKSLIEFELDQDMVKFFRIGVVLGICIITTLALFPGRTEDHNPANEEMDKPNESKALPCRRILTGNHTDSCEGVSSDDELMAYKALMERRRGQGEGSWTPHQQMNFAVYALVFAIAFLVLDFSYNDKRNVARAWIIHHFPREARAFGLSS